MIEQDNLRYFITEEIYLMGNSQETKLEPADAKPEPTENKSEPVVTKPKVSEAPKIHNVVVWTHELTDKDRGLLSKMLEAVKLDITKVHLISQEQEYTNHFKTLLSFGHTSFLAEKVDKEIILNEPFQSDGKSILVSYPISSLHDDVKKKGALWNGLKKMFH